MKLNFKDILNLLLLPFLVYECNAICLSSAPDFYNTYSVDTLSHFLGGLTIAYSIYYILSLLEKKDWILVKKNYLKAGVIITATVTIAVWWEFYEFISDYFLGTLMQPSIADTMKDLCMGMLGAVVLSIVMIYRTKKPQSPNLN